MTALQVIDTGEVVERMTAVEAERITARIADKLDGIADNIEQVMPLIREALTREAWKSLGYSGASAYVSERFAGSFQRLPVAMRRPIVAELSAAGMSTRAMAPVVGVSNKTVHQDLQVLPRVTPGDDLDDMDESEFSQLAAEASEGDFEAALSRAKEDEDVSRSNVASHLPKKVTGMDGKQYSRPEPQKPRRRPLADQAQEAEWELVKAIERVERIVSDDRFDDNKEVVTPHLRSHLINAIESCQGLLDRINN